MKNPARVQWIQRLLLFTPVLQVVFWLNSVRRDLSYLPPFFSIIRRLSEEKVQFVVVGGVAAIIYGVPRVTFDLDVVIDFSKT
jgi:hypothetical protein